MLPVCIAPERLACHVSFDRKIRRDVKHLSLAFLRFDITVQLRQTGRQEDNRPNGPAARRAPQSGDGLLILTRSEMDHAAYTPVPGWFKIRIDQTRILEIGVALLGLAEIAACPAEAPHQRGTVRVECKCPLKVPFGKVEQAPINVNLPQDVMAQTVIFIEVY